MRKLTLDQAAEELGIKRDSVYKRTRRHTLPYTIEPDGVIYVYLDSDAATNGASEEDAGPGNTDSGNQNDTQSWWDYAAGASALAVVVGVLIYALGLFALWAPIARTNTHDVITAWHSTSLVPRTVVAGLGIRQLVALPLAMGILMLLIILSAGHFLGHARTHSEEGADEPEEESANANENTDEDAIPVLLYYILYAPILLYSTWRVMVSPGPLHDPPFVWTLLFIMEAVAAFYYAAVSVIRLVRHQFVKAARSGAAVAIFAVFGFGAWQFGIAPGVDSLHEPRMVVGALINIGVIVVAATMVYYAAAIAAGLLLSTSDGTDRLGAVMVLGGAAFIAAFMLTVTSKPPLPLVEIDGKTKKTDDTLLADGTLLTHTDSFWYVFEERKHESGSRLVAIPDEDVKKVRVVE